MSPVELEWLYKTSQEMDSVVELGSWKGRSTYALLSGCKGLVYAIDHWKGSSDKDSPTGILQCTGEALVRDIHEEFMGNVGHFPNLRSYISKSAEAATLFPESFKADMVFIDAGHYYEEVLPDIEAWLPKTRRLICGHDYFYPDVARAVSEKLGTYTVAVAPNTSIWYVWLPAEVPGA